jgi:CRISPR-associated protein Csm1
MDIDNLGAKFIRSDFKSMKDYKRFSLALDWFFDAEHGRLHDLQIQDEYREFLNIVYAGGDDIFVVGRWDKVIDFAARIREEFKRYCQETLEEETLSISGGIAIVNAKFPIAKAAEMAGEAEDAAKKYSKQKNAFNMFGESISWKDEFDYVKSYKEQFVTLINKANLSRGILHKIMTYEAIVKENQLIAAQNEKGNQKRKPDLSYLWHTTYYLTRFMGKEKDNKAVYLFCKDLRDKQLLSTEKFRLMALAARWAELELRMNNSTNNKNE